MHCSCLSKVVGAVFERVCDPNVLRQGAEMPVTCHALYLLQALSPQMSFSDQASTHAMCAESA